MRQALLSLILPNRRRKARVGTQVAQELDRAAAQRRIYEQAERCCEGRPAGHTGAHWPLGGTHPAP